VLVDSLLYQQHTHTHLPRVSKSWRVVCEHEQLCRRVHPVREGAEGVSSIKYYVAIMQCGILLPATDDSYNEGVVMREVELYYHPLWFALMT